MNNVYVIAAHRDRRRGAVAAREACRQPIEWLVMTATAMLLALILLALAVRPCAAGITAPGYGFALRDSACAKGDNVLFGEIAAPWGEVPDGLWDRLKTVAVFPAPAQEGRSVAISRTRLGFYLAETLGDHAERCGYGPGITVWRGGAVLTNAELKEQVEQALRPRLAALTGRAQLSGFNMPESMYLSQPPSSVAVEVVGPFAPGRISLRIIAKAGDGKVIRQCMAGALLEHWAPVACAGRPVNPGEPIGPQLVAYKEKNLAYLQGKPWDGRSGATGQQWRVKRPVGTDQPFTMDNLEPVPVVGKGSKLTLQYSGKTVKLSAEAVALADGSPGQTIAVRNVHTGRTVQAVVTGDHTAEVRQ